MFWTAFIWGLGVSTGAAVGLLCWVCMFWSLEWLLGRSADKLDLKKINKESLEALVLRNELTRDTNDYLANIARSVRQMSAEKEL